MKRHNISIQIGIGFYAVVALAVYYGGDAFSFILAADVHEMGHIAAIALTGEVNINVELKASGIYIIKNKPSFSIKREALILLFGPIVGILAAIIGRGMGSFSEVSAMLSAVNLLPIKGTDGGSLMRLIYPEWLEGIRAVVLIMFSAAVVVLPSVFIYGKINTNAVLAITLLCIKGTVCDDRYI